MLMGIILCSGVICDPSIQNYVHAQSSSELVKICSTGAKVTERKRCFLKVLCMMKYGSNLTSKCHMYVLHFSTCMFFTSRVFAIYLHHSEIEFLSFTIVSIKPFSCLPATSFCVRRKTDPQVEFCPFYYCCYFLVHYHHLPKSHIISYQMI